MYIVCMTFVGKGQESVSEVGANGGESLVSNRVILRMMVGKGNLLFYGG
jgi:hypothetical protein